MRKDVVGSDKLCLGAWKEGVPNIFIPALSKKLQIFPRSKNLPIPYPSNMLWNMEDGQSILKGKPIKKLTSPRAGASHAVLLDGPNVTCSSHNIKREREREEKPRPDLSMAPPQSDQPEAAAAISKVLIVIGT
jgi:hypothetical protein